MQSPKDPLYILGIHESWNDLFRPLLNSDNFKAIIKVLQSNPDYYPERRLIFAPFSTPKDNVKVVLLGQDPYPNGQGIGHSFAVYKSSKIPYSLQVINNSICKELQMPKTEFILDPTLENWRSQGMMLLNTALTVKRNHAGTHAGIWKPVMNTIIAYISFEINPVWILLGAYAQSFKHVIKFSDKQEYRIIERSHPAAETYGIKFEGFINELNGYLKFQPI
jgi:uracil-DNA glycosylase